VRKKMTDRTAAVKSGIGTGGTDEPDGFAPLRALAWLGSIRTFIGEMPKITKHNHLTFLKKCHVGNGSILSVLRAQKQARNDERFVAHEDIFSCWEMLV
jgi:hypothetical protein